MKAQKGDFLYRLHRSIGMAIHILIGIAIVLLVLACIGISYKKVWAIWGIVIVALLVCHAVLDYFVKTEDEEEFEQQVEYILSHRSCEARPISELGDYTPLRHLSEADRARVEGVFRALPDNMNKQGAINMALVAHYLTALQKMGMADLTDKTRLRLWIAAVTKKDVPNTSQFNEAIPSTSNGKVAKAQKELEEILKPR